MAKKYWKMPGVNLKIDSIIADGIETMQSMIDRQFYFDFIFIDADKNNYPNYYELSLQLLSPQGILMIDNMLWHGDVINEKKQDEQTKTYYPPLVLSTFLVRRVQVIKRRPKKYVKKYEFKS